MVCDGCTGDAGYTERAAVGPGVGAAVPDKLRQSREEEEASASCASSVSRATHLALRCSQTLLPSG